MRYAVAMVEIRTVKLNAHVGHASKEWMRVSVIAVKRLSSSMLSERLQKKNRIMRVTKEKRATKAKRVMIVIGLRRLDYRSATSMLVEIHASNPMQYLLELPTLKPA